MFSCIVIVMVISEKTMFQQNGGEDAEHSA